VPWFDSDNRKRKKTNFLSCSINKRKECATPEKFFPFFFSRKRRRDGVADVPSKDISIKPNVWGLPVRIGMALQTHLGKQKQGSTENSARLSTAKKLVGDSRIHLYDCRVPVVVVVVSCSTFFYFCAAPWRVHFLLSYGESLFLSTSLESKMKIS
jgi:hypothetical protein